MKKRKRRKKMEEFEEIEYEPMSVKELLTEMKDLSELMVDLAYSAVIFDSEEIGEEVLRLETRMDKLMYQIRLTAMLASRTVEDAEQLSGILQVAAAAENISNAAGDIVSLLDTEIETRPFLPFLFQKGDEKIKMLHLVKKSSLVNRTLDELSVESETGVRIIAIRRGNKWLYSPDKNTKLKSRDVLIVRGVEDGYKQLQRYAEGKEEYTVEEYGGDEE